MNAILPVYVFPESDRELRQGHSKTVNWSGTGTVCDVSSREICEGTCESLQPSVGGPEIGWTPYPDRNDIWSVGRFGRAFTLSRTVAGASREFNTKLETATYRKMKDWRIILLQHLLQQNRSVTGEDKVATGVSECKQYCGMPLLTELAVMMGIDPLALVHGLREFITVMYGPVMSYWFPDVLKKACRNSVLFVNLVSVVDWSVLIWVEHKELRGLASDDRLFGRIAEPGSMLIDFNNNFKCRMGGEDLSHVQFNPKLRNLRPVVKDSGEAMRVPVWPEAYAHDKENQHAWLSGSRPLPD